MEEMEELINKIASGEVKEEELSEEEKNSVIRYCQEEEKKLDKEIKKVRKEKEKSLKKAQKYINGIKKLDEIMKKEG